MDSPLPLEGQDRMGHLPLEGRTVRMVARALALREGAPQWVLEMRNLNNQKLWLLIGDIFQI